MIVGYSRASAVVAPKTFDSSRKSAQISLSNANSTASNSSLSATWDSVVTQSPRSSGAYYCEFSVDAATTFNLFVGFCLSTTSDLTNNAFPTNAASFRPQTGLTSCNGVFTSVGYGAQTLSVGSRIMLAVDITNGNLWVGHNNTWQGGSTPVVGGTTGRNARFTAGSSISPYVTIQGTMGVILTFRSTAASQIYAAPSGFTANW